MAMLKEFPKVSIVIVNWNGVRDTIECLESLKKIDYLNYNVIVVDNASDGEDAEILKRKYGSYIYLIQNDKNYGFGVGSNMGTKYALEKFNPDFILLLNNDTVVDPKFLKELVKVAAMDKKIGITIPRIYYYGTEEHYTSYGTFNHWLGLEFWEKKFELKGVAKFDIVSCCAALLRREVIEKGGFFDPAYFMYYNDIDLCIRARRMGFDFVVVPSSKIWHKAERAFGGSLSPRTIYYTTRNRLILIKKYATFLQKITSGIFFLTVVIPKKMIDVLRSNEKKKAFNSLTKGIYDGLKYKKRL
jgi:hypothetical protein